jgi:pimeloyl-ACP methyl ester carboxylesterase
VVTGAIAPVDPHAPDIHFEINLPANWNGKAVHAGGGGYDGLLVDGRHLSFLPAQPLDEGYATFGSDSGHAGNGNPFATMGDASFAANAEALANFGGAQLKKVHDAAAVVILRYYGRPAKRTYFYGNSQGGHEGLIVAQRFPDDYDGVVSIHPAYDFTAIQLSGAHIGQGLYGAGGAWLSPAKTALIANAVMKTCDGLDGLEDGVIANVAACRGAFHVGTLRCPTGRDEGPNCLSDAEITTAVLISRETKFGFSVSGVSAFSGWPIFEGAFSGQPFFGFGTRPNATVPPTQQDAFVWLMADQGVRNMFLHDTTFDSLKFKPTEHVAEIQKISDLVDASSADLDAFQRRGGKLLLMHGTVDMAISPGNTTAYYERLRARYGKRLDDFVRFYLAPGFGHGDGSFRVNWDSLSVLDRWADAGEAPGAQTVTDAIAEHNGRTRPLCAYPAWPKYKGAGDPNRADSFACVLH